MQDAQEVYKKTILNMPSSEQLRLAALILSGLTTRASSNSQSALELLEKMSAGRTFESAAEADEHLREERDSWDR
jgi:hypothetical protein